MRTIAFLLLLVAAVATESADEGTCAIDGAEAVSDALDASMYIWASIARCGHSGEMVKCEIGVSSSIGSVNSMINVILRAVEKCGSLNTVNPGCGFAASELTKHAAGLSASSGLLVQKCFQGKAHGLNWNHADPAMCVVNIKNTAKSLFKLIKSFMKVEDNCNGDEELCAANALQIVSGFAAMGEYLAGTVGKCSPTGQNAGSLCAAASQRLVQQLTAFSERAISVAAACEGSPESGTGTEEKPAPSRLYSTKAKKVEASSTHVLLIATLPVTAIVGFVGGRIFGSRRSVRNTQSMVAAVE